MANWMAYGRMLAAAAWVVAVVACGDDDGGGPVRMDAGPPDGGGEAATTMYVGPAGIGQENNPRFDGLSEEFPIDTLTRALDLRFRERAYRSVDTIVLLPGEYFRNEEFPIEINRPSTVEQLVIRGGAATRDRAVIRNDRNRTPPEQLTGPILDVGPGVAIENLTVENRYVEENCLGQLISVLLEGEAEARQIVFDNVEISGGSPCHTHIGVESNANVLFQDEVVIDGGDRAGGLTTTIDGRFASGAVIEFRGNPNRNCTGIRFLDIGPRLFDMGMPRRNTGNPGISLRGDNEAIFDQVCIRPGDTFGERTAVEIRGEVDVTFTGLEIQTSDGTINGERFAYGVAHSLTAGATGETVIDGASIDARDTGLYVNGGSTTVTNAEFTQSAWGIQRADGDLSVRNSEFTVHGDGGIRLVGRVRRPDGEDFSYAAIDLGTASSAGNNIFRFSGEEGSEGDIEVCFDDPGEEEPAYELTIPALGQTAWSPTISGDVVCRFGTQEEFNIDICNEGVQVEYAEGETCGVNEGPTGR